MLGRGVFGDPWLLGQCKAAVLGAPVPERPPLSQRVDTALRQFELAKQDKGVLARLQNLFAKMSNGFSALEYKSLNLADKLRYNRIKDSVKADLDFLNGKTAEKDMPMPIKDNVR